MHPKKWNAVCWLLLLLWLIPIVLGNLPFIPDFEDSSDLDLPRRAIAYDATFFIGWPFSFLEIQMPPNNLPPTKKYSALPLLFNLVIHLATLASLVFVIQRWIPKFTIRTLMVGIAIVAVLITVGQFMEKTDNFYIYFGFTYAVFFSPLIAMIPTLLIRRLANASRAR